MTVEQGVDHRPTGDRPGRNQVRLVVVLALIAVVAALIAIPLLKGGAGSDVDARPEPTPYTDPIGPDFTLADQAFVDYAASQVQEAEDLAAIAADHDLPAGLDDLATRIHSEQKYQLGYLFAMLQRWNLLQMHAGHPHPTPGGLQPGQIDEIDALGGDDFVAAWASAMYTHHEGAIYLAQGELREGSNLQARTLARAMLENAEADRELLGGYLEASPTSR